jgi:restriction system protein
MAVPDFQSFFKPLLEIAADGAEHSLKEARDKIAAAFALTSDDLAERLPSGTQTKFDNRVAWAKSYFVQAKVLDSPKRGLFKITDRGKDLLKQGHEKIDIEVLNQYPEFVEFRTVAKPEKEKPEVAVIEGGGKATPEEVLQQAHKNIRNELAVELLNRVKENTSKFFENLVVDLLVAMGYGGSRADAGQSIGQVGDEGIDGIIKEDKLGLDVIYLQAKRWDGTVGRPEIQKFVGALHGKRAKKGVFLTTGKFSDDAYEYVSRIEPKVILIDGRSLANFMIDLSLGTTTTAIYEVKRIDSDYFVEE